MNCDLRRLSATDARSKCKSVSDWVSSVWVADGRQTNIEQNTSVVGTKHNVTTKMKHNEQYSSANITYNDDDKYEWTNGH